MAEKLDEDAILRRLSTKSTAKLAGLSERQILNLARDGLIEQVARGKYDAFQVLAAIRDRDGDKMTPLKSAQLSLREEQARKQKLENDAREARLVPIDDVHEFQNQTAGFYVRSLESVRKGLGAIVDAATRKKVDRQIRDARQALENRFEAFRRDLSRGHKAKT